MRQLNRTICKDCLVNHAGKYEIKTKNYLVNFLCTVISGISITSQYSIFHNELNKKFHKELNGIFYNESNGNFHHKSNRIFNKESNRIFQKESNIIFQSMNLMEFSAMN